jgi:hypothetical protein
VLRCPRRHFFGVVPTLVQRADVLVEGYMSHTCGTGLARNCLSILICGLASVSPRSFSTAFVVLALDRSHRSVRLVRSEAVRVISLFQRTTMRKEQQSTMNVESRNKEESAKQANDSAGAVPSGFILKLYQMVNGAPDEVISVSAIFSLPRRTKGDSTRMLSFESIHFA